MMSRIAPSWWELSRPKAPHISSLAPLKVLSPEDAAAPRHCILLHGWHSTSAHMRRIENALRALPSAAGWRFWQVTYDTHWKTFRRSARQIAAALQQQPFDFHDCILIGYSMGGIVARQMVADGFSCRALIALCSPHEGTLSWAPPCDPGAASLVPWSRALATLNRHPRDIAGRSRYHFCAISYSDGRRTYADDGLVPVSSALGEGLGELASRRCVHLRYRRRPFPVTRPHWEGMNPQCIAPALDICDALFSTI